MAVRGQKQITTVGGDLWHIAAQQLGDATQAIRIALLNGIWDPMLVGTVVLSIPPIDPTQTGGLPPS